jgi:pimeloyl-ACP methyl ester carboxylesterase
MYDEKALEWPIRSEAVMVETSYGRTFVRISGPADAPPLVLLHGVGGNSLQWLPNIEALSERYRTYAVDNIYDNGRSVFSRVVEGPDDLVTWLNDVFAGLDLEGDINIVGLSFGGWVATQYALKHPDRMGKMVLLAPAGTVLPLSPEWMLRAALCAVPHRYFAKSFMYWLLEDLAQSGETGRALLEQYIDESYLALRSFKTKRMVNPTVLTDEEWQSIRVPTLYIVGENEKIYSAEEAVARLNRIAPGIRTEVIPGAGHDLTIVKTEMVDNKILAFLDGS